MKKTARSLCGMGFLLLLCTAFGPSKPIPSENTTEAIEFNIDGLYFAEFYDLIYRGHFENIEISREDTQFLMIFEQYLRGYGRKCDAYLPAVKAEIMEQVCDVKEVSYNGYGQEIGSVCVKYRWDGTGLFARPELYNAKVDVENIQRAKGLETFMSMILDPNAMGNSVDMIHKINGLKNDMIQMFVLNKCDSPGLRQFEQNLAAFAQSKKGVRMQEESKYTVMKAEGGPTGSQNYAKLIDDLVANQAQTWAFNKYNSGSISGVTTLSKDTQGRPKELKAYYSYSGFGNSKGWVKITFKNGLPDCMYFFDFPANCKSPNSSIVSSYAQGKYAN